MERTTELELNKQNDPMPIYLTNALKEGPSLHEDLEEELDLEKGRLSEPREGTTSKGLGGRSTVGFRKENGHKNHGNGVCHGRRTGTMRCMVGGLSETQSVGQERLLDKYRCEP